MDGWFDDKDKIFWTESTLNPSYWRTFESLLNMPINNKLPKISRFQLLDIED